MKAEAEPDELSQLAQRARQDQQAMDELLARLLAERILQPPIRRYLFAEDDVDVVEQQALVAVAFKIDQWSGTGAFGSWVRQIAANEAKDLIRSRDRRQGYETAAANRTAQFVERLSSQLATEADVTRCLERLEPELSNPLRLRRDGYNYEDISTELGIPVGTAKTRVRKARLALSKALTTST